MSAPPVDAHLRFVGAMQALLESAEAMAEGNLDTDRRAWALTHAQRTLREVGGMQSLTQEARDQVNTVGQRIRDLDSALVKVLRARCIRIRHSPSETRVREGRSGLGRQTDCEG